MVSGEGFSAADAVLRFCTTLSQDHHVTGLTSRPDPALAQSPTQRARCPQTEDFDLSAIIYYLSES